MAQIIKEITVDVAKENLFQSIVAKQYDSNSRFLKITVTNEGQPITVSNDATPYLTAEREDNNSASFLGVVNEDGTITVPITAWMLALDGKVSCHVSIVGADNSRLSTLNFTLTVEYAADVGEEISEDDDLVVQILSQLSETVSKNDVVSNCVSDGKLLSAKIPNAYAMYEFLKSYAVVANATQSLSDEKKARARENIGAVGKDTYELIESIVTTEECQQVTRTAEPDGTAYAFAKCLLRVVIPATTAAATVSMNISTSGGAWLAGYYKSSATRTNATTNYMLEAYQSDGIWKDRSDCVNTYSSATMNIKSISEESYKSIGKVSVSLSTTGVNLPVGTKIEIYGVRA